MDHLARATHLLDLARARCVMLATAESCTGGIIAGAITEVAGSSDAFDRGFITYSNTAKMQMLGVLAETLKMYGAVSEQVAREMAAGALGHSDAALAVSVTGIAGPGSSDNKPEGRVCFGLAVRDQPAQAETVEFGAIGRSNVRQATVARALEMLITALS